MKIHADLLVPASVDSGLIEWVSSPTPGVDRKMLERDGVEVARATTIVRFAPGMKFPAHTHDMGEEFLVLDGVFSDENGDYPVGSYLRHVWGSIHAPHSQEGCVIFVKLRQMHPKDTYVHIDTNSEQLWKRKEDFKSVTVDAVELFRSKETTEVVEMHRWQPSVDPSSWQVLSTKGGLEIFVIEGTVSIVGSEYKKGLWIRLPDQHNHGHVELQSKEGCKLFVKHGHLPSQPQ